jgi:hydrophobic/amphiphilic exporter-1 (mainly G- bacteria), HAE1 family
MLVPLTAFSLRNPVALTLFFIFVVVLGMLAVARMGRSILPPISVPVVSVAATYPGASPREIQRLLVEPIDEEIAGLPDISRVSASAQSGIAEVVIQFRFGSNLETDRANVQNAVEAARANMPVDLVPPVVSKDDQTQAPILEESISSVLVSPADLAALLSRRIIPALRATGGVGPVASSGAFTRQFTVRPRIGALDALGATSLDLLRAVAAGNDLLPGGLRRSKITQATIGIDASMSSAPQIAQLPVPIPGSPPARVADVASITDGYADRTVLSRVDGDEAVLVSVAPALGADSFATIAAVRRAFAEFARRYPLVRFEELRTVRPYTDAAIDGVLQTLGEGVILTTLVMLLFLHAWRNALISAISIPTSLCAAFAAMWAAGFNLNVLSLMGLSLTIGILVDDSIVIIEAISRAALRGLRRDEAALAGRRELGGVAFAVTLVDVAVFLPIGMMTGIVGEFMREFALVIVFATAFSLLVSCTLTPVLSARWALTSGGATLSGLSYANVLTTLRARARTLPWTMRCSPCLRVAAGWHAAIDAFNAWEGRLAQRYSEHWLPAAFRRRSIIAVVTALACAASLIPLLLGWIPSEFSPPVNRGELNFDLTMPPGTPTDGTDAAAQRIAQALLQDGSIRHVETTAGQSFNGSADIFASNVARIGVILRDPSADGQSVERRVRSLAAMLPSASLTGTGKGMGGVPAVSYDLGGDPALIDEAARRVATVLRQNPLAADLRTSDLGLQPHLTVHVDFGKSRLLNISPDDVAQTARIATGGAIATKARLDSGLVNIIVQADESSVGSLDALQRLQVRNAQNARIPLGDVTHIEAGYEPTIIQSENGERVVSVSANAAGDAPISLLTSSVGRLLRDPKFLPPGTWIEPRGDIAQFLDTVARMLMALGLSIVAVYVVLAILYRSYTLPLVIMLTVPLASIGAFGSLFLLNTLHAVLPGLKILQAQTLNLYSMLGIIMLVGLVAKNGVLLVEYAERALREGAPATLAMTQAAKTRLRPILMTTFAMIAGMLPLALGETAGAEYRKALGTVVIGGLSTSLLLTLFVVPMVYVWHSERRTRRKPASVIGPSRTLYPRQHA